MQHNLLASEKPDPPGPEYLLMTSVCQPLWREECSESEERGAGGGEGGGRDGKGRESETWGDGGGGQEGNKQPCESTSSVHKGRAFTKVSPEALSCHEARKGNWPRKRVADFISTDNELCTSSRSLRMVQIFFPTNFFATWQKSHINSFGTSFDIRVYFNRKGSFSFFFLLLSFVWLQSLGPPPPLCVTAPWLWRWHFIFPLPPETWALSFTTDHTGTLSIPLLDAPIIGCVHKAFF